MDRNGDGAKFYVFKIDGLYHYSAYKIPLAYCKTYKEAEEFVKTQTCECEIVGKGRNKPDITFKTDKGRNIRLVWEKNEFRAYDDRTGQDLRLGATVPKGLIEYINRIM